MNPDIKARWVAALRSGEFKQGKGYLAEAMADGSKQYCCLGVLCEIAVQDGVVQNLGLDWGAAQVFASSSGVFYGRPNEIGPVIHDDDVTLDDWSNTELPVAVTEWAGLDSSNPAITPSCICPAEERDRGECSCLDLDTLATLNDADESPDFDFIADVIEEQL